MGGGLGSGGGVSRSVGQVRAEASVPCAFLYIVSMATDPRHNAGTFFPTRQLRWFTQAGDGATMNPTDNGPHLKGHSTTLRKDGCIV